VFKGKYSILKQFTISLIAVLAVSAAGLLLHGIVGYKMVGFIQLLLISILALSFEILPVLASAFISALLWNYLFIPPRFNFEIDNSEDIIFFLMYFVIAGVHTALTFKIRKAEKQAAEKEEKEKTKHDRQPEQLPRIISNTSEGDAQYILIPKGSYLESKTKEQKDVEKDLYFAKYPVTNKRYR
jgi:K+-sensing histidine kinase KdpD